MYFFRKKLHRAAMITLVSFFLPVFFVNAQSINYNNFNSFERFSLRTFCTFAYCESDNDIKKENNLNIFERISINTYCTFSICKQKEKKKDELVVSIIDDDSENKEDTSLNYYPQAEIQVYRGARGHQGPQGEQGISGEDGARGSGGYDGEDGRDGSDGGNGARGPRGFDGSDGVDGVDGIGAVTSRVDITAATSDGVFNSGGFIGYEAANNMCATEFAGSHFCRTDEIISYIAGNGASGLINGTTAWIAEGPPGYTANSNDCNGWTSNINIMLGAFWEFSSNGGGMGWLTNCAVVKSIACCQ